MTNLRVSLKRLSIESDRWSKPNPTQFSARKCLFCNLHDHPLLWYPFAHSDCTRRQLQCWNTYDISRL